MLQVNPWDPNGSGVQWIKSSQTLFVSQHRQQLKVAGVAAVKTQVRDTTNAAIRELYLCLVPERQTGCFEFSQAHAVFREIVITLGKYLFGPG